MYFKTSVCLVNAKHCLSQVQGLFALDAATAKAAMLQFQSCVRTTLLLCDGYECQEKVPPLHLLLPFC